MNMSTAIPFTTKPGAFLLLLGSLSVCPLVNGVEFEIDNDITFQTIDGFGTCCNHWTAGVALADPEVRRLWSEDLRGSIIRFSIPTNFVPNAIDPPDKMSYQNFHVTNDAKLGLEFTAALSARDPSIKVLGTAWSPPGWMKTNGRSENGGSLRKDRLAHYGKYLSEVVLYMQNVLHTPIYAISPQNELIFKEPYDSCLYSPALYAAAVAHIGDAFQSAGLTTKILGPEDMTDADGRIMAFINAINALPEARKHFDIAASHGYVDGVISAGSANTHNALWKAIEPTGLPLWMTETSGETPAWAPVNAAGKPGYGALTLGMKIHNALVYGHCSAWIYWCYTGDFSKAPAASGESLMNMAKPTKKYFVSKQFYRWIRPEAQRIAAGPDGTDGVMISAYHRRLNEMTVVLINTSTEERPIHLTLKHTALTTLHGWRTSGTEDCIAIPDVPVAKGAATMTVPGQSVTTLTTYTEDEIALPPVKP
jgi:glucuronoarabinoxylan endo-1,4-beta-xylanase